jgi:hypothetical protein
MWLPLLAAISVRVVGIEVSGFRIARMDRIVWKDNQSADEPYSHQANYEPNQNLPQLWIHFFDVADGFALAMSRSCEATSRRQWKPAGTRLLRRCATRNDRLV